jgi:TnpA family transposase
MKFSLKKSFSAKDEYEKFIETGKVSEKTLLRIARKLSKSETLTDMERAIFFSKTGEVNEILISIHQNENK